MNLTAKHCVPCEGGVEPFDKEKVTQYLTYTPSGKWENLDYKKIRRDFHFNSYMEGINFAVKVGEIAESEGHHPDIHIYYKRVEIILTTHAIGGLSENDFILASKIDALS